ncbi:MAG: sulfotransferase [Parvibaculum sp.]|nr:sulfotransferase [Parvibaculum sp.]
MVNFLGIGPPKCGTTWLDLLLRNHPQIVMPEHQKEVFFFSRYHDRGRDWYEGLFQPRGEGGATGEISTNYIGHDETLARIAAYNPDVGIIILLRDPFRRMVSHYRMLLENAVADGSLTEVVEAHPHLIEYSRYSERLAAVARNFRRDRIFVAIYEEIFSSDAAQEKFLTELAGFLNVDAAAMLAARPEGRVRETKGAARSPGLTRFAKKVRRKLRDHDLEWLTDWLRRIGIDRSVFLKKEGGSGVTPAETEKFSRDFEVDRTAVEAYLGRPIPLWEGR